MFTKQPVFSMEEIVISYIDCFQLSDYDSDIRRKELSILVVNDVLSVAGLLGIVVGMLWAVQSENLGVKHHA